MSNLLDPTDRQILNILQLNARLEIKQIAGMVHKSTSPVHERIRKLHDQGYIKRYIAVLDREKIGRPILALAQVTMAEHTYESHMVFVELVNQFPEVTLCLQLSGPVDFMLHICVPDTEGYDDFLKNKLMRVPQVSKVNSCFILRECKINPPYPL